MYSVHTIMLSISRATIKSAIIFAVGTTLLSVRIQYSCFCVHNARPRAYCCHVSRSIDSLFKRADNGPEKGFAGSSIYKSGLFFTIIINIIFYFLFFFFLHVHTGAALISIHAWARVAGPLDRPTRKQCARRITERVNQNAYARSKF